MKCVLLAAVVLAALSSVVATEAWSVDDAIKPIRSAIVLVILKMPNQNGRINCTIGVGAHNRTQSDVQTVMLSIDVLSETGGHLVDANVHIHALLKNTAEIGRDVTLVPTRRIAGFRLRNMTCHADGIYMRACRLVAYTGGAKEGPFINLPVFKEAAFKPGLTIKPLPPIKSSLKPRPENECDRLAAHPLDAQKIGGGVEFDDIDAPAAMKACLVAVASDPTDALSRYQLGRAYHRAGKFRSALEAYHRARNDGHTWSTVVLARYYSGDMKDIPKSLRNIALGRDYYKKCAAEGIGHWCSAAMGRHADKDGDYEDALRHFRRAASHGNASAANNIGVYYQLGKSVKRDYVESAHWYRHAARLAKNNPTVLKVAQDNLKQLAQIGWLTP